MTREHAATSARSARIYPGWWVVLIAFLANFSSVGFFFYAFGVFVTPLTAEFGWSRAEINIAISFNVLGGLMGPVLGVLLDRRGPRFVMLLSLPVVGLSYLLRAFTGQIWQFYLANALTSLAQAGEASLTAPVLITRWFDRWRGRVMGLTLMGTNAGGLLAPPLAALLIDAVGWRWTYWSFACFSLLIMVPLTVFVLRDAPEQLGLRPYGASDATDTTARYRAARSLPAVPVRAAVRSRPFWAIAGTFFVSSLFFTIVITQIVPHLERIGVERGLAATTLGVMAVFAGLSKLIMGYLIERWSVRRAFALCYALQAAGLLLVVTVSPPWMLVLFPPVLGLGYGAVGVFLPVLVQEAFGLASFGRMFALLSLAGSVAGFLGGPAVGLVYDLTTHYEPAFAGLIVVIAVGMLLVTQTAPRHRPKLAVGEDPID